VEVIVSVKEGSVLVSALSFWVGIAKFGGELRLRVNFCSMFMFDQLVLPCLMC